MSFCLGIKQVKSTPMTRQEYNTYRGWDLPKNENGDDAGYLVEYLDSPSNNHPDHEGYISWSPSEVFEKMYINMGDDSSKIQEELINRFIKSQELINSGTSTIVKTTFLNGFTSVSDGSCVDPKNYDEELCKSIATRKAEDTLWLLLGFVLAWARNGISYK